MAAKSTSWKEYLEKLTEFFETYLVEKAPALPPGLKEFIVKVSPWVSLILMILLIPLILAVVGIGLIVFPVHVLAGTSFTYLHFISVGFAIANFILHAMSIKPLMERKTQGWNLIYYATLLGVVQNLITGDVLGTIIGRGITLYVLFQVRKYYK